MTGYAEVATPTTQPPSPSLANGGTNKSSRIPLALQAVFIASNRGKEVNKAPPKKMGQKTYLQAFKTKFPVFGKKRKIKKSKHSNNKGNDENDDYGEDEEEPINEQHQQPAKKPQGTLTEVSSAKQSVKQQEQQQTNFEAQPTSLAIKVRVFVALQCQHLPHAPSSTSNAISLLLFLVLSFLKLSRQ